MADYIDREDLLRTIESDEGAVVNGDHERQYILQVVRDLPAVGVVIDEPARRLNPGECDGNVFGPCSVCGAWYDVMQGTDDGEFNFCPHCGRMFVEG